MIVYNTIQNDARVIRAAEALSKIGYNITVLSCNSDLNYVNPNFESVVYTSKSNGPLLLLKFYKYILRYVQKHDKFDCYYMHDYFLPYLGKRIKKHTGKPFIYDAHELLFQRKEIGYTNREKLFLLLEQKSIGHADLVIAANDERLRLIRRIYNLKNAISVGNIAPSVNVPDMPTNARDKIIVYQGVLSEERNVSSYINVLTLLPNDIKLKLIGNGPDVDFYKQLCKTLKLEDRVIFTGRIPYSQLLKESSKCRIGIVNYLMDDLNNFYCSPNKLFEYTQCKIPVICSPQPFLKEIVDKYHIGEIWDWRTKDITKLSVIIKRMMDNTDYYCQLMDLFNKDYNSENELSKLTCSVDNLLSNG